MTWVDNLYLDYLNLSQKARQGNPKTKNLNNNDNNDNKIRYIISWERGGLKLNSKDSIMNIDLLGKQKGGSKEIVHEKKLLQ